MKKMGKKFIAGSAMAITAISSAALLSGCFLPGAGVYGPPPDPATEINETVYGPPEQFESTFEPDSEINEDVYGPPMETQP